MQLSSFSKKDIVKTFPSKSDPQQSESLWTDFLFAVCETLSKIPRLKDILKLGHWNLTEQTIETRAR